MSKPIIYVEEGNMCVCVGGGGGSDVVLVNKGRADSSCEL